MVLRKHNIIRLIAIHFVLIISLISCSKTENKTKDHLVFRYNEHSNISSLDPAFARNQPNIWATNQLFNSLVQLDSTMAIKPDIAKSWVINDTLQTLTFYLRKDVYFHKDICFYKKGYTDSTRIVTAYDFEYSFKRLQDPKVASPGAWVLQDVASYKAINDTTFTITLKHPFPPFLGLLSMRYCSVVPKEAIDYYANAFRSHPVGTGPFYFKLWEENNKLVFRKNKLYFESDDHGKRLPYLEAVAITFLPEKQSEFLKFLQGQLDMVSGIDNSYKDEVLTTKGDLQPNYKKTIRCIKSPFLNTEYLGFFMESDLSEIQSKKLRQAINYGFDRKKMITYLRNNIGFPANNGFIPKGLPGFANLEGYRYKPQKALALVEAYKSETGDDNPQISIATNSQYLDLCEYIQRELEKIGISVTIDVMPPATLRQQKSAGKLPIFRASWIADYPDAENYLSLFYSPNFTPNGPNYTHFKNQYYDSLYTKALTISDIEKRKVLYTKMDSVIIAEAPVIPLYYDMAIRFVNKNVHGLGINPQNFLVLKYTKKQP